MAFLGTSAVLLTELHPAGLFFSEYSGHRVLAPHAALQNGSPTPQACGSPPVSPWAPRRGLRLPQLPEVP